MDPLSFLTPIYLVEVLTSSGDVDNALKTIEKMNDLFPGHDFIELMQGISIS